MQFTNTILAIATALSSLAAANTVNFVNQDGTTRNIVFTPQDGQPGIAPITIGGYGSASQDFPNGWIGNWYSYNDGAPNVPGMLGEVRWNGYGGNNYYDVSAIVNPNDVNGVKEIFPQNAGSPVSGCQSFPCANAYNTPDDIATLSTTEDTLVCLIGNLNSQRRHARSFVGA
jgi:hypothetical protein